MANNASLHAAGVAKQDEFYTQYEDIQNELNHYEKHFRGMTVLCNCDDPFESNFCKFFLRNFNYLGLKRLICTSYHTSSVVGTQMSLFDDMDEALVPGHGYVMDIREVPMANGRGVSDDDIDALLRSKKRGVKKLNGDGDFRSEECIEYLKQADIVVTNPPFSLFREYVALLMKYEKRFLIIGNQNNITYKEIFPLIQQNKIWLGWKFGDMAFRVPDHYEPRSTRFWVDESGKKWRSFGTICWYTNLDHDKRHEELVLYRKYYGHEEDYPHYANYDAINVDRVADIPCDYFEEMGVPITYLDKHNPEQFEILGITLGTTVDYEMTAIFKNAVQHNKDGTTQGGGKVNTRAAICVKDRPTGTVYYTADNADGYLLSIYPRILIRRRRLHADDNRTESN